MGSYGERIRKLRESLGLSQQQFAQKLGIHKQMVSDVERGKQKRFRPEIEKKIIELFGNDSFLKNESTQSDMQLQPRQLSLEEEILLKYFQQIPKEKRLDALACIFNCLSQFRQ